jgi:hypothetical protein
MISDDDLLLYHYRELEPADRARISTALSQQPELAQRLHALVARLDAVAALPEVPVPVQTQQRWQAALDRASHEDRALHENRAAQARRPAFTQMRWQLAAAAVAVVALGLVLRQVLPPAGESTTTTATQPTVEEAEPASAYENGLKFHLASTERRLASLEGASPEERARLVEAIIGQNRIYALAAERAGEPQLARVLRAFTPVLEDVAQGRGEVTANSLAQLNFELRVMQARLSADARPPATL